MFEIRLLNNTSNYLNSNLRIEDIYRLSSFSKASKSSFKSSGLSIEISSSCFLLELPNNRLLMTFSQSILIFGNCSLNSSIFITSRVKFVANFSCVAFFQTGFGLPRLQDFCPSATDQAHQACPILRLPGGPTLGCSRNKEFLWCRGCSVPVCGRKIISLLIQGRRRKCFQY